MKDFGADTEGTGIHIRGEGLKGEYRVIQKMKFSTGSFTNGVSGRTVPGLGTEFKTSIQPTGGHIGQAHRGGTGAADAPDIKRWGQILQGLGRDGEVHAIGKFFIN